MSETERVLDPKQWMRQREADGHTKISILPIPDHLMRGQTTFAQRPPLKHLKTIARGASN